MSGDVEIKWSIISSGRFIKVITSIPKPRPIGAHVPSSLMEVIAHVCKVILKTYWSSSAIREKRDKRHSDISLQINASKYC